MRQRSSRGDRAALQGAATGRPARGEPRDDSARRFDERAAIGARGARERRYPESAVKAWLAAALDAGTGKLLPWRVGTSTNDPFSVSTAITATDQWVILGGDYTRIIGAPRAGIAAVSVTGSTVASWHPTRQERGFEATFIAAGDDLYVYDYDDAALAVFSTGT